jgi:hypothetical protein
MNALVVKIDIAIDTVHPCSDADAQRLCNQACMDAVHDSGALALSVICGQHLCFSQSTGAVLFMLLSNKQDSSNRYECNLMKTFVL